MPDCPPGRCANCNGKDGDHRSWCKRASSAARYKAHEVGTGDVCGPAAPVDAYPSHGEFRPGGERYFPLDNPIAAAAFNADEPRTVEDIRREREAATKAAFVKSDDLPVWALTPLEAAQRFQDAARAVGEFVPDQADVGGPSEDAPPYCPYHDAFHEPCTLKVEPDCPVCSGYPFEKHREGCPRDPARAVLPDSALARKNLPLASGLLDYFPAALTAVAALSQIGNEQHNPGQPMHWNRAKSGDEADALLRHLIDRGTVDTDGVRHSVKAAWRALALLQKELEEAGLAPLARGAR